ncbi:MAG: hypothetical protein ACE5LA_00775 [Dehalococcoidales bacterium]
MKYLPLKIWLLVTITLALSATIIRLAWEIAYSPPVTSLVIIILVMLGLIGIYVLFIYFTIKPNLGKLKSLPVVIPVTVMATVGLASGIAHFTRYVPSPLATEPLSIVIATLFLLAGASAYFLLLWIMWSIWKSRL